MSSTSLALYQSPVFIGSSRVSASLLEVADRALDLDVAELVALAFLDHVGDDEVAPVGRQLGDRRDDPEIGIAVGQVELPQLLLVEGEPVGIVARRPSRGS